MTAAVVTVAGCTDDTPSDPPASGSGSEQEEIDTSTPGGPTPEELSEQVLTAPRDGEDTPAIGTATGTLAGEEPLTVDVLAVRRLEDATFVTMRWTAPVPVGPGFAEFYDRRREGSDINFARTLFLEDPTASGLRLLPLQFEDYRFACTCPYFPMEVGPEPQVLTAVYPALPAGTTTVDLRLNDTDVVVTGLPVS